MRRSSTSSLSTFSCCDIVSEHQSMRRLVVKPYRGEEGELKTSVRLDEVDEVLCAQTT